MDALGKMVALLWSKKSCPKMKLQQFCHRLFEEESLETKDGNWQMLPPVTTDYQGQQTREAGDILTCFKSVGRARGNCTPTRGRRKTAKMPKLGCIILWRRMENKMGVRLGRWWTCHRCKRESGLFHLNWCFCLQPQECFPSWKMRTKPEAAGTDWNRGERTPHGKPWPRHTLDRTAEPQRKFDF